MICSAFHNLSSSIGDVFAHPPQQLVDSWQTFLAETLISYPSEPNNPAGSGNIASRIVREEIGIPNSRLFVPEALVSHIVGSKKPPTIVFVDDFAGTGLQFTDTWVRKHIVNGREYSFASLALDKKILRVYFTPAICTSSARRAILDLNPIIAVEPAHILPPQYSAKEWNTRLVPSNLTSKLDEFLRKYAPNAGYDAEHRYGVGECGLAISFEHSTPDNTLPVFNGGPRKPSSWTPLRSS